MTSLNESSPGGDVFVRDLFGNKLCRFDSGSGSGEGTVRSNIVISPAKSTTENAKISVESSETNANLELAPAGAGQVVISGDLDFATALTVSDTTQSTSSTTGALVVAGGVGIAKDVNVAGTITATGGVTFDGTNILSTYIEQAAWTPAFAVVANLTVPDAIVVSDAYYTQIGNLVFASCNISGISVTAAAGTQTLLSFNYPVAQNIATAACGGSAFISDGTNNNYSACSDYTGGNSTQGGLAWNNTIPAGPITIAMTVSYLAG